MLNIKIEKTTTPKQKPAKGEKHGLPFGLNAYAPRRNLIKTRFAPHLQNGFFSFARKSSPFDTLKLSLYSLGVAPTVLLKIRIK